MTPRHCILLMAVSAGLLAGFMAAAMLFLRA